MLIYRLGLIALLWLMAFAAWGQQQASLVKEIVIQGNQRVSREAILAAMRTKVGQPYIQDNLDRDRQSLLDLGFFQAVDVRATPLEATDWRVTVDLREQPEIKEIRVVGNSAVTKEEILKVIEPFFKVGDVYNENSRNVAGRAIRDLYVKKGFGLYGVEDFGPLAESPSTLNISVLEAKVGQVGWQGNKVTQDRVMRRLIKTRPGDPFSEAKWIADLRRLYNTQWFESVESLQDQQSEVGKIDLIADVKETRTGQFNVGLQLDPRNSLAGVISLKDTNFRGSGQSVGLSYIQATTGSGPSIDLDYTNPFFDNKDTTFRMSVYSRLVFRFANAFNNNNPINTSDQYFERRTGTSFGFSRPIRNDLSVGLSARYENVKTDNLDAANGNIVIQQDGDVLVGSLGGVLNRRDRDIDPTRGDWLRVDLEPGYSRITKVGGASVNNDILGSNTFFRSSAEYRRYFTDGAPLGRDISASRRVLALRVKYGTIQGQVPFFEQFFAGGADTVRGYQEDRFWGRNTILSTAELRLPVASAFSFITFVDYGGAWGGYGRVNDYTQSDSLKLNLGYGVGLSFRTPLGPIRLDVGFNDQGKSRTHFLIGTSF